MKTIINYILKAPFRLFYWLTLKIYAFLAFVLPSRRIAGKAIFYQLFILGWVLTASLAHSQYVITCAEGGHFMSRAKCNELAENRFDSQELARQTYLSATKTTAHDNCIGNEDICK